MARPKKERKVKFKAQYKCFKPCDKDVNETLKIELKSEEIEALRLKHLEGLNQTEAGQKMKISQSTFQRIIKSAYEKVSNAIVNGNSLVIED